MKHDTISILILILFAAVIVLLSAKLFKGGKNDSLFHRLMSPQSEVSSRRFIVLIVALNWVFMCFALPVVLYLFIIKERNTVVINRSFDLLDKQTDYAFWLLCVGLGFITTSGFLSVLFKRVDATIFRARSGVPETLVTQQVEEQTVSGNTAMVQQGETPEEKKKQEGQKPSSDKEPPAAMPEFREE